MKEPNDNENRKVLEWKPFENDPALVENELLGENGPECTCPSWWFPLDIRKQARLVPHLYQGALSHHEGCAKTAHYWKNIYDRHTDKKTRYR